MIYGFYSNMSVLEFSPSSELPHLFHNSKDNLIKSEDLAGYTYIWIITSVLNSTTAPVAV